MYNDSPEQRIEQLRQLIEHHNKMYYVLDNPEIEDSEYDTLLHELIDLENKYPQFQDEFSPTRRVGGEILNTFDPVRHDVQMGSLQDVFSIEGVYEFDKRVRQIVTDPEYVVEPKIDGLSVSLEYHNGKFTRASTRGDGFVGEDVTNNVRTIMSVPVHLPSPIDIEVRGEVYIPTEIFEKLTQEQENNNQIKFKNPRNAAAGSLRQKNPRITASRKLDMFIFNVQKYDKLNFTEHTQSLDELKKMGFNVIPSYKVFRDIEKVIDEIYNIRKIRNNYGFDIDGAVVKLNRFTDREELGSTSKFPKWAVAFKYPPEEKETKLIDININVGRTGVLTPTAVFEPIVLAGTTVSRAVLHNQELINKKKIGIGDIIIVRKAGDIIPEVVAVKQHQENSSIYQISSICPSCGSTVVVEESARRCINFNCPAQLLRHIIHFVSRPAMDIDGIGKSIIEKMVNNKIISSVVDLYYINIDDILKMERMRDKSANNIIKSIENSKSNNLDKLIFGFGIHGIGQKASKQLAEKFVDIENIFNAKEEDISTIDGFGDIMVKNVINYFSLPQTRLMVDKLKNVNVNTIQHFKSKESKFEGFTFVLTGTLENMTRTQAKEKIENLGGKVVESISNKVNYVLAGDQAGSKLTKAQILNIPILSETEFNEMIK